MVWQRLILFAILFSSVSSFAARGIDGYSDTVDKFWNKRLAQYYRMDGSPLQTEDLSVTSSDVSSLSSSKKHPVPEIQIAGDSWGVFTCVFGAAYFGLFLTDTRAHVAPCFHMGKFGINSDEWLGNAAHQHTLAALQTNKKIKILYLVLGGNDFLNYWSMLMTPDEEAKLFASIRDHVQAVIDVYRAARPDLKILVSGYDYGRFDATAKWHYKTIYNHMGQPTPLEQNSGFIRFSNVMSSLATADGNVAYIQHFGVSHYWFGLSEEHIRRKTTLPPALISPENDMNAFGGLPQYKDDASGMLRIDGLYVDPMHLSPTGFRHLFEHSIQQYIGPWVKAMNASAAQP